jgi:predicted DNA binding CopG/RHH family protein
MKKSSESSARGGLTGKSGPVTRRRKIDYSDIPELSDRQLAQMRRVGRPPLGERPKKPISIRLDERILNWVKRTAAKRDQPYQSLISEILEKEMKRAG